MTDAELQDLLQLPLIDVVVICRDGDCLVSVLKYAIQVGIREGHKQSHEAVWQARQGYTKTLIKN